MTPARFVLTLALVVAASPALASDCLAPALLQPETGMSTVAPEMIRVPIIDPSCIAAADALALLRLPAAAAPGVYVPLTKDDNTPWRFDMRQNGRQMTAAEFEAWMKAKGIHVATGKAAGGNTAGGNTAGGNAAGGTAAVTVANGSATPATSTP